MCSVQAMRKIALSLGVMKLLSGNGSQTLMNQKKMRKFSSFMAAAVAMLAAVSCNKEINNIDPVTPGADAVVYTAYVDGAETKTSLGAYDEVNDKTAAQWDANDQITIHNGTQGYTFTASEINGGSAKFTYVGNDFNAGEGVMAVYPGCTEADPAAKTVKAYIPTYQGVVAGDYKAEAALAVAYADANTSTLNFKNACAILKFTVKENNIKGIEFYGNNNEAITGNMLVSLNSDNTIKSVGGLDTVFEEGKPEEWTGKGTWIKCYSEDPDWCFNVGETYYAVVAPCNFTKGVSINFFYDDGNSGENKVEKVMTTDKPFNLEANTILDLGELEYIEPDLSNENWGVVGSFTNWADNNDVEMNVEGNWYIARDVEMPAGSEFKFRTDGKWGTELTYSGSISAGQEYTVAAGSGNIVVNAGAVYDVYLSPSSKKMKIVKVGDISPDAKGTWSLTGSFSSWDAASKAYPMIAEGKWFICRNFKLDAAAEVKLVENYSWDSNRGGTWAGKDKAIAVTFNGANIAVPKGTYDVYMNADKTTVYFMTSGNVPSI